MSDKCIYDFIIERTSSREELSAKIDIILDDLVAGKLSGVKSLVLDDTELTLRFDFRLRKYIGSYDWGHNDLSQFIDRDQAADLLYHIIHTTDDLPYDLSCKQLCVMTVQSITFY